MFRHKRGQIPTRHCSARGWQSIVRGSREQIGLHRNLHVPARRTLASNLLIIGAPIYLQPHWALGHWRVGDDQIATAHKRIGDHSFKGFVIADKSSREQLRTNDRSALPANRVQSKSWLRERDGRGQFAGREMGLMPFETPNFGSCHVGVRTKKPRRSLRGGTAGPEQRRGRRIRTLL